MISTIYTFDNPMELAYDSGQIAVITSINDPTPVNPFTSGSLVNSGQIGAINGSGYVTNSGFVFVASGSPFVSSGETISFDFGHMTRLRSYAIDQNPDNFIVNYRVLADHGPVVEVFSSTYSGNIRHQLPAPVDTQTLTFEFDAVNPNLDTYEVLLISGQADPTWVQERIPNTDLISLSASSNAEPVQNLYDQNPLTYWQSNNSYFQDVIWYFNQPENIVEFDYVVEDSITYPTQFTLSSSLDGVTYQTLYMATNANPVSGSLNIPLTPGQARYLKWHITAGVGTKVRIREVTITRRVFPQLALDEIKLKKKTLDGLSGAISLSATSESGSATIGQLKVGGFWQTLGTYLPISGSPFYSGSEHIQIDIGVPQTLDKIEWAQNTSGGIPVDFKIFGSQDNITYNQITEIFGNVLQEVKLDYDDQLSTYRFYRIIFATSTDPYIKLDAMRFLMRQYPNVASIALPYITADHITTFSGTVQTSAVTTVSYQISVNNKKYWWDGSMWSLTDGTIATTNDLSTIQNNLASLSTQFGTNMNVAPVLFLASNQTDTPVVSDFEIDFTHLQNQPFVPKHLCRITGYLTGFPGNTPKPIEIQISLVNSTIVVEGETIGFAMTQIFSDSTGYFDFSLPQTELAQPPKARYQVLIPAFNYNVQRFVPAVPQITLANFIAGNF